MLEKYPAKIIIAWGEALDGNKKIYNWLLNNGYPELAALSSAIHASRDALNWLLEHEPRLAILSNAIDGEKHAISWLVKNQEELLLTFADACNDDKKAKRWLAERNLQALINIADKVFEILKQQRHDRVDYHKIKFFKG